jgi:uncharacterized protein
MTAVMKPSKYNSGTTLSNGTRLFFNFYTLNLLELNPQEERLADSILDRPDEEARSRKARALRKILGEKGFLINEGVEELEYLRDFHDKARNQTRNLGLTLLPSLACNLRCVYCYETPDVRVMSEAVQEAVVGLVRARLQREGSLSVTWFGGEPLLNFKIIENLSRTFMAICDERKAKYSSSIITNGYLLDTETAEKLVELKVGHAQITLDGPEQIHDARRPTAGGAGSFNRIYENILAAAPILPISLRINVDQTNRGAIADVLDLIAAAGLQNSVHPYLGHTLPYNKVCQDVASCCIANEDFSLLDLETSLELIKKGFKTFSPPKGTNAYCLADNDNAYVITPTGGVVNCWNDSADPSAEIAHLLNSYTEQMRAKAGEWLKRDPFALECAACLLLPICMGGCPFLYLKTGRLHCHKWKYHLDENIAFYHFLKKIEREAQVTREFYKIVDDVKKLADMTKPCPP